MSGNYTSWFTTFRNLSNEGLQQNAALAVFGDDVPGLFPGKDELTVVEFGCGKAAKAKALLDALQAKGIRLKYTGLDISDEMLAEAQQAIPDGKFYNHSIFKPVGDAGIVLPQADTVLVIHSGYYGYNAQQAAARDTTELQVLMDNIALASGPRTAMLSMHKSPKECTNAFKEKHSAVVESHATGAIRQLLKKQGVHSFSFEFPGVVDVPVFTDAASMPAGAKDLAQFFSHQDIDVLPPEKRQQICEDFLALCQRHLFKLPTYTEVSLNAQREAPKEFVRGLEAAVKDMKAISAFRE